MRSRISPGDILEEKASSNHLAVIAVNLFAVKLDFTDDPTMPRI
jgi:hypothetical protein